MMHMNKAVLISIRPEWCEKIASGQKTIEVRKTRPKIETPFRCYIYCNKQKIYNSVSSLYLDELYRLPSGEIKFGSSVELSIFPGQWNKDNFLNGKIIGEFVCDKLIRAERGEYVKIPINETAIDVYDFLDYAEDKTIYGWHISDLVIYDKPKELGEFSKYSGFVKDKRHCKSCDAYMFDYCENMMVCGYDFDGADCPKIKLTRPPQNWCYVEELDGI